jgi:undecaprenyl-diphosphatase
VPLKIYGGDLILANPLLAGCLLPVTGLLLLGLKQSNRRGQQYAELSVSQALWIGISQAVAILPGLSRSGTTISTGYRLGLAPDSAVTFSFLLAIPAIGGACVLELAENVLAGDLKIQIPVINLVLGAAISFVIGLISLSLLVRWVERGMLHYFAWWCIPLGLAVVAWQLST